MDDLTAASRLSFIRAYSIRNVGATFYSEFKDVLNVPLPLPLPFFTHIAIHPVCSYAHNLTMNSRNLPHLPISVEDLRQRAQELRDQDDAEFVKFVLTSKYGGRQAVIDPILDSVSDDQEIRLTRDYDSVLGMCPDIRVEGSLTVTP